MQGNKTQFTLTALLIVMIAVIGINAGGPLVIWNAEQRIPYRYNVSSSVPVYTDLGPFAVAQPFRNLLEVSNERGDEITAFAIGQWVNVETSSFDAHVQGDFASIGLPDVRNAQTAGLVIGPNNGGGIHVIYDHDGAIMQTFFGASPSTLGVATPEWADTATGTITESWVVINGRGRQTGDNDATHYAGVVTHEFGHSINLAHSQTNGAIIFSADGRGPSGCATVPYSTSLTTSHTETMYPFIAPQTNGTGQAQSTVDLAEDKVAISNLYPSANYASTHGSISGHIRTADGVGLTGINVIARNIADPYAGAVSVMSGDYVRVQAGNDGSFTVNGLTPGAQYALYTDAIRSPGSFPTAAPFYTPGPEDFYNGANESGNALTDDRCQAEPVVAVIGDTVNADITINAIQGAPKFKPLATNTVPTSISSDGSVIGGAIFNVGVFRYTEADGYELVGSTPSTAPRMSRDGSAFVGEIKWGADRVTTQASILNYGGSWQPIPVPSPEPPVIASPCDTVSSSWGVAANGSAATGLIWVDVNGSEPGGGCRAWPFLWTPEGGSRVLPLPSAETRSSRSNNISGDGSTVVGWWEQPGGTGFRFGLRWINGNLEQFSTPELSVGEAYNVTPDGSTIVGMDAGPNWNAWRWTRDGGVQQLGRLAPFRSSIASAVSDNGKIVAGLGGTSDIFTQFSGVAFIWTPELGMVSLEQFLQSQGTYLDRWVMHTVTSMSSNGTRMVGSGGGPNGPGGWILDLDKINLCHAPPGSLANARTINVAFADAMADHLIHGDTIGLCIDSQ